MFRSNECDVREICYISRVCDLVSECYRSKFAIIVAIIKLVYCSFPFTLLVILIDL